jgi:hypothetical protein
MLSIVFVMACLNASVLGQASEDKNQFATVSGFGSSVRFDVAAPHSAVTLTVLAPDGQTFTKEFQHGSSPEFRLTQSKGESLPDGQYIYELRVTPIFAAGVREALKAARAKGNDAEVQREMRRRGTLPSQPQVQSGSFLVVNGSVVPPGATEQRGVRRQAMTGQPAAAPVVAPVAAPVISGGRIDYKVRRHHPRFFMFVQVIPDDLVVQGSGCFGFDCVSTESFGTDTVRLKENNTRLQFDDTSTSAGFASNNWQIRANDQPSGGASFLGIVDQGTGGAGETGTIVFAVNAGAPANSIRVSNIGKVGFRTATPGLDMHANTNDTPAIRLEQNNTGGFTAQTWDIGANEANFFVRDLTGGSRLPFRIRPGAPTSSLDISADGDIGIGTASPAKKLHLSGTNSQVFVERPANTAGNYALINFGTNGAEKFLFGLNSDADPNVDKLSFFDAAFGSAAVMTITGGNVGIGTPSPTDKFVVNGTASKPGGGTWAVFSDERLKRIRGKYNSGLKAVMQLQPIRYEYTPDNALGIKTEGEHIGFGAQSVQKVIPEAVTTNGDGFLMVNNDPIIWTMLNAIKEQQKEIVELKRQVRQLRATTRRRR